MTDDALFAADHGKPSGGTTLDEMFEFAKKALSDEGQPMPFQHSIGSIVWPVSNPSPEACQRMADLMGMAVESGGKTYRPTKS